VTRHFPKDARLLDVGCGGAWIGDHFDDYTGIDVSPEAVELARARGRQVLLVDGDEPLPFDEESFDGVVLKDVLEHVTNPVTLVREVRACCGPAAVSSPRRQTRSAGSGTTTPTAARSPGRASGSCSKTRGCGWNGWATTR
jgi:2-polyprenyl-3-methyl-5-hydroxy-6-metoxy-1,4-benzoquinol methylase